MQLKVEDAKVTTWVTRWGPGGEGAGNLPVLVDGAREATLLVVADGRGFCRLGGVTGWIDLDRIEPS